MLDIFDINYEMCSEKLGILNLPPDNLPKKGVLLRILSLVKRVFFYGIKKRKNSIIEKNSILFFTMAENEVLSIEDIAKKVRGSYIFGIDSYKNGYPAAQIYFFSLFFIPVVFFRKLICKNEYHKKSFSYNFDGFCIAYSSRYVLRRYLRRTNPKKIIIANQLSVHHRSLAIVAKELSIETIYIQHASITKNFSSLNIFSKSFLEGEDSLKKVQTNGTINTTIYLIGMPKFDRYFDKVKKDEIVSSLGICTNGMDDFCAYERLISYISLAMPDIKIILRSHPSDRRKDEWLKLSVTHNISFSDVKMVKSFDFFDDVNLIISGDSNIHLEAALLNIPSIYFDPLKSKIDWYGFLTNNLVYYAEDEREVVKHINSFKLFIPSTRKKVKFYVENVSTIFDGKSSGLASLIIEEKQNSIPFIHEIDNHGNNIFRLN
jgi:hypothetical protein